MSMPVMRYHTNSDFPGIDLCNNVRADYPRRFDNASYSECKLLDVAMVLVPWEYRFNNKGGGDTKPAIIVDSKTYRIVKLRRGVVVPRQQSLLYHPSECAYWLQSELCSAIHRHVQQNMVLRCLDPPVRMSVNVKGSAVVEVG
jgi:hypothetical protein